MITIFTCADQMEDMLTCIYDAWASRLGHAHIRLKTEPIGTLELFCRYVHVMPDPDKAASVLRTIKQKISPRAAMMICRVALSDAEDKLDTIYRFLLLGFSCGASVLDRLQEPAVLGLYTLDKKVSNEAHYFREFIRFSCPADRILLSHIEPKSNILTLVAPHFADRLPSEHWMIVDDSRRQAIVHPADAPYYLTALSPEELEQLSTTSEDKYTTLWKEFFTHIAIKERKNPRCQQNLLPLWYRKHMPEFS